MSMRFPGLTPTPNPMGNVVKRSDPTPMQFRPGQPSHWSGSLTRMPPATMGNDVVIGAPKRRGRVTY